VPVWLVCTNVAPATSRRALEELGVETIEVAPEGSGRVDVQVASKALGAKGLTRVLVEGGGQVSAAFLKANLIDRVSVYRAGLALGADARSAVGDLAVSRLDFAPRFRLVSARDVGGDTVETWRRRS
jgi:diaminohydroxyphosphoribosylaminopyrimidine deaminase/5-amino-6-(5-phosphoribosylamino)uracil reductase